jgi:multidrug efflux pump subunit AcrA (membrane-fusion protein)
MSPNVDLSQLAVRRHEAPSAVKVSRPRHLGLRIFLPGVVLVGFLAVVIWAARDRLLPARPVTVASVVTTSTEIQNEGTPMFQAAGWIEPRPTPVLVPALTEGVVEKLLVVEGQRIEAGQEVAKLIQEDAQLALQTAQADLELRQAEVESARTALAVTRTMLPFQLKAARSRLDLAQERFDSQKRAFEQGASPLLMVPHAKSELDLAASAVAEVEIRAGTLKEAGLRPFAEAEAVVKAAVARSRQAEIAVATARLRLDRTIVRSPVAGQVIALLARPGQRLMGQAPLGMPEASTVISMFDPSMVQVRADVRLEDVPRVQVGQRVQIGTPVTAAPLDGEVLQMTSQADIQKNTLQVKVAVKAPPPTLRPDMLVEATFLAPPAAKAAESAEQLLRVLIPKQLVESAEGGACVWTADLANKVARKKAVKLGRASGDFVEVTSGLNPADRLIVDGRQGLSDGERIAVRHVDVTVDSPRHDGAAGPKRLPNPDGAKGHSEKR